MPAKSVIRCGTEEAGAPRAVLVDASTLSPEPSVDRLDLLAAEIAADALRAPAEVVERFDTRQQGE